MPLVARYPNGDLLVPVGGEEGEGGIIAEGAHRVAVGSAEWTEWDEWIRSSGLDVANVEEPSTSGPGWPD